jgi:hypothetical protein
MNVIGASGRRTRRPLAARRAERELFFWTAREVLKLVVLTALTAYFVICLIDGRFGAEVLDAILRVTKLFA